MTTNKSKQTSKISGTSVKIMPFWPNWALRQIKYMKQSYLENNWIILKIRLLLISILIENKIQ